MAAKTRKLAPHIVSTPGTCGGRPRIEGHRITVDHLAACLQFDMTPEEMATEYELTLAEVHAALAYYFDNREEIDDRLREDERWFAEAKRMNPSLLREKLASLLE